MAETPAKPTLLDLATSRFVDNISPAEKKLFEATEKGERAACGGDSGEKGVIRSDRLSWLCTDPDAAARVTYRGVLIVEAEIDGEVDLEWAKISFPLRIRWCVFKNAIILRSGRLFTLDLLSNGDYCGSLGVAGRTSDLASQLDNGGVGELLFWEAGTWR